MTENIDDVSYLNPLLYSGAYNSSRPGPEKLIAYANGADEDVKRMVMCTEDSIDQTDLPKALANIKNTLLEMDSRSPTETFVRVRDYDTLKRVLDMDQVTKLAGFVIPKALPDTYPEIAATIRTSGSSHYKILPILETRGMFDAAIRKDLRETFADPEHREQIECLRIGGNDLMNCLDIRRSERGTIYDISPMNAIIGMIVGEFKGMGGFPVTAPVNELFHEAYDPIMHTELQKDIANGLFGKTVIHPRHARIAREMYKITSAEHASALRMVAANTQAAYNSGNGIMDEPATHSRHARIILARAELFGVSDT